MGKAQNHPLRAFTPSEEQELHCIAKATSERLDVVKRARAILSVQAGWPFTEAAHEGGTKVEIVSVTPRHMMLERGAHSNWAKNAQRLANE